MKFQAAALTLACIAGSASAGVAQPRGDEVQSAEQGKTFSIDQIPNERYKGNIPAAYISALAKYSPNISDKIKHAIEVNPDLNRKFSKLINAGTFPPLLSGKTLS